MSAVFDCHFKAPETTSIADSKNL